MSSRQRIVRFGAIGLLALSIVIYRVVRHVPTPIGIAAKAPRSPYRGNGPFDAAPYEMREGEVLRYLPAPAPSARRDILEQCRARYRPDLLSLTVVWRDAPRVRTIEVGREYVARPLLRVLRDSLEVPLHRIEGIEVAQRVRLSGDWAVRADAPLDDLLADLELIVQRSGYPGFRITRTVRRRRGFVLHGPAKTPPDAIDILECCPGTSPAHVQSGSLGEFVKELSNALRFAISVAEESKSVRLKWRNNAGAYFDLNREIPMEEKLRVLHAATRALGLAVREVEVKRTVWRLEMND
ncbi:MAG: hypothetical protein D6744_18440 [Planctomycetota bacterium]|nr:MAG: hypothetical protein D6744_18440 [Planctomycetota bacterium]